MPSSDPTPDWTTDADGVSNSSQRYDDLCSEVERLIRQSASDLIQGRADMVARLIVSQLAHVHGMAPDQQRTNDRP